jgi:hypothetical protein
MSIITLTSDYGLSDPYAAAVKGQIFQQWQEARIVDISHQIHPDNLMQASFVLRNAYPSFPEGTVHLILVKELHKAARWLAYKINGHHFISSDCGLLAMVNPERRPDEVVEINYRVDRASLFPGRDFLSAAAAHLAKGGQLSVLGRPTDKWQEHTYLRPRVDDDERILGAIIYVDNRGNLITNISRSLFKRTAKGRDFKILLPRNKALTKISQGYFDHQQDGVMALFNSSDLLEISYKEAESKELNGASSLLSLSVQNSVTLVFEG